MKAVLIGNYGVGNLGDEALRQYFLERFSDVEWRVISANPAPGEYARLPLGIRSFVAMRWMRTLSAMPGSDIVVFGGGSLFTDVESVRACLLWGLHAAVALLFRKPVILAFQGIGPFHTRVGEAVARRVCRYATSISVRDAESAKRVESWNLNKQVIQTFDPVIALFNAEKCKGCSQDVIAIVPRFNSGASFEKSCETVVNASPGVSVEVWMFEPDRLEELKIAEHLAERFLANIRRCRSLSDIQERLRHVRHVVTQRYHGALFAFGAGCPVTVVEQKEGDKLWAMARMLETGLSLQEAFSLVARGEQALCRELHIA